MIDTTPAPCARQPERHLDRSKRDHRPVRDVRRHRPGPGRPLVGGSRPLQRLPHRHRGHERWPDPRPSIGPDRDTYDYLPNTQPIFARGAVNTLNRDFDIVTTITPNPSGVAEGVILAHGNRLRGYSLFVQDDEIRFVYNLCGIREYRVTAPLPADGGPTEISIIYKKEGDHRGDVQLIVGDAEPVEARIGMTIPWVFPAYSSLNCGLDRGLSVCPDYESPFASPARSTVSQSPSKNKAPWTKPRSSKPPSPNSKESQTRSR